MKVILVGGYPGIGKSTIMRDVVSELSAKIEPVEFIKDRSMDITRIGGRIFVMGRYGGSVLFPGTDTYSMAIQPKFEEFVKELFKIDYDRLEGQEIVVLLEGDRLVNGTTIKFLHDNKINYRLYIVRAQQNTVENRRKIRSDKQQDPIWRKGRETKVDNIAKQIPHTILYNNSQNDFEQSIEALVMECGL